MKKMICKLAVRRETLRALEGKELTIAAGGTAAPLRESGITCPAPAVESGVTCPAPLVAGTAV